MGRARVVLVACGGAWLLLVSLLLLSSPLQLLGPLARSYPHDAEACTQGAAAAAATPAAGDPAGGGGAADWGASVISPFRELQLLGVPNPELDGLTCLELTLAQHRHWAEHGAEGPGPGATDGQPDGGEGERPGGRAAAEREMQRDRAPRTLWYESYAYADVVMDRFFLHAYCGALAASPPLDNSSVAMWGPGEPVLQGWRRQLPLPDSAGIACVPACLRAWRACHVANAASAPARLASSQGYRHAPTPDACCTGWRQLPVSAP